MNLPLRVLPHPAGSVVVADDDEESRSEVAALLRAQGLHVVELRDGRELNEHLLGGGSPGDPPLAVIAAMFMPGVNGLEVSANAKDSGLTVPIILTASLASDELLEEARRAGVHAVLESPLDHAQLCELVAQAVLSGRE